ncbi:uncharacterized protein LOC135171409 [Diachasmimorpha longicaudata]|uniref:uncharacterized protein LOC135171409 n=1 Tax=Diachasmimorpha longicaudata TaxID=58733 RepID=UPI0030B8AED6
MVSCEVQLGDAKKMTKSRCKICELLGESEITREHGLSDPCHLSSLQQLNHFGLCYVPNSNIDYANHGLLNGSYLPQLKDMMLAAYLLREFKIIKYNDRSPFGLSIIPGYIHM